MRGMGIKGHSNGGRSSKGERHIVTSRMPIGDARKLFAIAASQNKTVSDYVADLVLDHIKDVDVDQLPNQVALPLERAG